MQIAAEQLQTFVQAYVDTGLSLTAACKASGVSLADASIQMTRPSVLAEIRRLNELRLADAQVTATTVRREVARIAFFNPADLFKALGVGGSFDIGALPPSVTACIKEIEFYEGTNVVKKLKFWDKNAALGLLARHFKLVGDETSESINNLANVLASRLRERRRDVPLADIEDAVLHPVTQQPTIEPDPPSHPSPPQEPEDEEPIW